MGELPLGAERSLVDCLAPSAITGVKATATGVRVSLGVEGHRDDAVTVTVGQSIEDMSAWVPEPTEISWWGSSQKDVQYAAALAETLRQAVAVAEVLQAVIEKPYAPVLSIDERAENAGWPQIQQGIVHGMADYALALFVLLHGGRPAYTRGDEKRLSRLREQAVEIAMGAEVIA